MRTGEITKNFTWQEMTASATAVRRGIDNEPHGEAIRNLTRLCRDYLQPLRDHFGPIHINSAFRSPRVNEGVHGVGNSKHLYGEAADIRIPDLETGRAYYRFLTTLPCIDQLLFEHRRDGAQWIHVSSCLNPAENRHQYFPNYRVK